MNWLFKLKALLGFKSKGTCPLCYTGDYSFVIEGLSILKMSDLNQILQQNKMLTSQIHEMAKSMAHNDARRRALEATLQKLPELEQKLIDMNNRIEVEYQRILTTKDLT